jgi:hypothetical protein
VNPEALIACYFCRELNQASLQMCRNCGLEKREPTEPPHSSADSAGDADATEDPATVERSETNIYPAEVDAASEPESAPWVLLDLSSELESAHQYPRRRLSKKELAFFLIATSAGLIVMGLVAAVAISALMAGETSPDSSAQTIQGEATADATWRDPWQNTPAWSSSVAPESVATVPGGVASEVGKEATVVDDATGDIVATQQLGLGASPRAFQSSDTTVVYDDATLWTWAAGDTQWRDIPHAGDTSVWVRVDATFVFGATARTFAFLQSDAVLLPVTPPASGAAPLVDVGSDVVWVTTTGSFHVTTLTGDTTSSVLLVAPKGATRV